VQYEDKIQKIYSLKTQIFASFLGKEEKKICSLEKEKLQNKCQIACN